MTEPIDPVRRVPVPRPSRRSGGDRRKSSGAEERPDLSFPVPTEAKPEPAPEPPSDAAFAAQILGQGEQKRGLRGGKEVLDKARGAYLGREFSGEADRRPPPGLIKKTEI